MFDDHQQQPPQGGGQPPKNLPVSEPEDMFADTDPSGTQTPQPPQSAPSAPQEPQAQSQETALGAGALKPVQKDDQQTPDTQAAGSSDTPQSLPWDHAAATEAPSQTPEVPPVPSQNLDGEMPQPSPAPAAPPVASPSQATAQPQAHETPMQTPPLQMPKDQGANAPSVPPQADMGQQQYDVKEPVLSKGLMVVIIASIVLLVLGGGGWWVYNAFVSPQDTTENNPAVIGDSVNDEQQQDQMPAQDAGGDDGSQTGQDNVLPTDEPSSQDVDEQVLFGEPIDSDGDSLDDEREEDIGTDPENWDSDGDELSDGDEVIIWKTDPLNPDTDGDNFLDGEEVKNGYSPSGPGKIFEPPSEDETASAEAATSTEETDITTSTQ